MKKIDHVRARIKVDARHDLAQVKRRRAELARVLEAVQVVPAMVGSDNNERVNVRQEVGEEKVCDHATIRRGHASHGLRCVHDGAGQHDEAVEDER